MLITRHCVIWLMLILMLFCFVSMNSAVANAPDYRVLMGKWIRPNGGYVVEIKAIGPDGSLAAGYYNPRSIHVEKAHVNYKQGDLEVFIKLQDVNYPGSTYRLIYNRENDILEGTYFQAVDRIEYQIYFERLK